MKCPYCGYQESKVVILRHSEDGLRHPAAARVPLLPEAIHDV